VVWRPEARSYGASYALSQAESASDRAKQPGYIRLPGPPGLDRPHGLVGIRAEGYALFVHDGLEWDPADLPHLDARLVTDSSIAGVVLHEGRDIPMPGASVSLT
jgi:hypothetical protein